MPQLCKNSEAADKSDTAIWVCRTENRRKNWSCRKKNACSNRVLRLGFLIALLVWRSQNFVAALCW